MLSGLRRLAVLFALVAALPAHGEEVLSGHLAFIRVTDGYWQVWQRDLETGEELQLTTSLFDKRYPEWDNAGGLYFRSNNDELFRISAGADEEQPFASQTWPALDAVPGPGQAPVALIRMRTDLNDASALYTVDRFSGSPRLLTPGPGLRLHPSWSGDGTSLAYVETHGATSSEIKRVAADGHGAASLISDDAKNLHPAYAPTGRDLAYASDRTGDFEIWLHKAGKDSAESEVQLTRSPGMDTKPTWSPDGSQLAFASYRHGRFEIWVMAADGTLERPLIAGEEDVRDPAWR
jgi:Tol biopolymer transport system component